MMRRRNKDGNSRDFKMDFIQLNQRKCTDCTDYINRLTNGKESFIHLGQEPYVRKGNLAGLNKNHQVFNKGANSRAYIYAHKYLPILLDAERSDDDTCTALWITKDSVIPKIQVTSSYLGRLTRHDTR